MEVKSKVPSTESTALHTGGEFAALGSEMGVTEQHAASAGMSQLVGMSPVALALRPRAVKGS